MARGYETITDPKRLAELNGGKGITRAGRNIPGLLIPLLRSDGRHGDISTGPTFRG